MAREAAGSGLQSPGGCGAVSFSARLCERLLRVCVRGRQEGLVSARVFSLGDLGFLSVGVGSPGVP